MPSGPRRTASTNQVTISMPRPANEHARAAPSDSSRPMNVPATAKPRATATRKRTWPRMAGVLRARTASVVANVLMAGIVSYLLVWRNRSTRTLDSDGLRAADPRRFRARGRRCARRGPDDDQDRDGEPRRDDEADPHGRRRRGRHRPRGG